MIAAASLLSALAAPPGALAAPQRLTFREFDLPNGLHVILHEDRAAPLVTVSVWYHVGSRDETPGHTGFAHLFEHMMFQGSDHVGKMEHFRYVQEIGGTLNATTSFDRTTYFETVPRAWLGRALWLESDRMRSLAVTRGNLDNQRAVVQEERRQRYENVPYGTVLETLLPALYHTSGYRWPTIGSMEDLDRASIDEVRAFHARYYVPNNATLVVAGDFDPADARTLVGDLFGDIPRGDSILHEPIAEPPLTGQMRLVHTERVPHPLVVLAFRAVPDTSDDATAVRALAEILGGGNSAELYRDLVYEKRVASTVEVQPLLLEATGFLLVSAAVAPGATTAQVEQELWRVLERVRTNSPSARDVAKARNKLQTGAVAERETIFHRSQQLSAAWVYFHDTDEVNRVWEEIDALGPGDVLRAARAVITPQECVVLHVEPPVTPAPMPR